MNYSNIVVAVSAKLSQLTYATSTLTSQAINDKLADGSPVVYRPYQTVVQDYPRFDQSFTVNFMQTALEGIVPTPEWFANQQESIQLHDTLEAAVEASGYTSQLKFIKELYEVAAAKAVVGHKVLFASSTLEGYHAVGIFLQDEEMAVSMKLRIK